MKDYSNLMREQLTEIKRLISKTEKALKNWTNFRRAAFPSKAATVMPNTTIKLLPLQSTAAPLLQVLFLVA